MKSLIIIFIATFGISSCVNAQGCVAIRSVGGLCTMDHGGHDSSSSAQKWILNINNRYYNSYKHFVGEVEQTQRVDAGTQVINHAYTMDIAFTRILNSRWSLSFDAPIISNTRSSLYEHDGATRHTTHSFGVGDVRFSAYRWMFDPKTSHKGNLQLGLGIKLPTGNYNYMDYFYKKADSSVLGPVDQSIQPGDGGTGITFEVNSFYNFSHKLGVYGSFFYLSNPREVNGTSTTRGGTASATAKKYNTDVMSVPDLFMTRAGVSYMIHRFNFSGGVRIEGLPSKDLIGGSRGFRRPGYIISAEPSITYVAKKTSFNIAVPFALKRNRTQSDSDKRRTAATGTHVQGDTAFADYLISVGFTIRL